jgi:hypothetical protein
MVDLLEETFLLVREDHCQDDEQQPYRFIRNDLVTAKVRVMRRADAGRPERLESRMP